MKSTIKMHMTNCKTLRWTRYGLYLYSSCRRKSLKICEKVKNGTKFYLSTQNDLNYTVKIVTEYFIKKISILP